MTAEQMQAVENELIRKLRDGEALLHVEAYRQLDLVPPSHQTYDVEAWLARD